MTEDEFEKWQFKRDALKYEAEEARALEMSHGLPGRVETILPIVKYQGVSISEDFTQMIVSGISKFLILTGPRWENISF